MGWSAMQKDTFCYLQGQGHSQGVQSNYVCFYHICGSAEPARPRASKVDVHADSDAVSYSSMGHTMGGTLPCKATNPVWSLVSS